ncbi:multidrug MFS transporter [Bacillus sp. Root239]|nr:multidrug MFS transporter [Bacillus sp. Root239]
MAQVVNEKFKQESSALGKENLISGNESRFYIIMKRTVDISGAILGLVFLSWLFILVALLIKIEDPKGPVFFSQRRVGRNGEYFNMYKFRSMVADAEARLQELIKYNETSGAMFKMKNDPRVTKIGRFIRKTSIDELPQLLNVLKGEMSLVGPRPPLPREVEEYTKYQFQRLLVTPGCTGLWQISGRSNIGFEEMVELDISYIQSQTIISDLAIIAKTIGIMFSSKGAY